MPNRHVGRQRDLKFFAVSGPVFMAGCFCLGSLATTMESVDDLDLRRREIEMQSLGVVQIRAGHGHLEGQPTVRPAAQTR